MDLTIVHELYRLDGKISSYAQMFSIMTFALCKINEAMIQMRRLVFRS